MFPEQDVVVGDEAGLAQGRIRLAGREDIARAQRLDERRLGNAVEVQVVLADELVDLRVLRAPEVAPAAARQRPSCRCTAMVNAHGRPQAFGPAPHRQALRRPSMTGAFTPHSMLPVMRKGTSALPVRKRMPAAVSTIARRVAVRDGRRTLSRSDLLALPRPRGTRCDGSLSADRPDRPRRQLVLDVDHRGRQELLDGLRHDGAHFGVGLQLGHARAQEVVRSAGRSKYQFSTGRISGVGAGERRTSGAMRSLRRVAGGPGRTRRRRPCSDLQPCTGQRPVHLAAVQERAAPAAS